MKKYLLMLVMVVVSVAGAKDVNVLESFDYKDFDALKKSIKISTSCFASGVQWEIKNNQLVIKLPPVRAGQVGKITLDLPVKLNNPVDFDNVFEFKIDSKTPLQVGLYVGNKNWSLYRSVQKFLKAGNNNVVFAAKHAIPNKKDTPLGYEDVRYLRIFIFSKNIKSSEIIIEKIYFDSLEAIRNKNK